MKLTNTVIENCDAPEKATRLRKTNDRTSIEVIERYKRLLEENADPNEWAFAWRTELNRGGFPAYEMLNELVVNPGKCIGCAACVSICPVDVFDYVDEKPVDTRTTACVQSFVYILMNNGVYGLTKGQRSPTATAHDDGAELGLDGISLGLSIPGSSFIARSFSSQSVQLEKLTIAAIEPARARRGFAFLEVLSPGVTYNDTYAEWAGRVVDVNQNPDYDSTTGSDHHWCGR